MKKIVVYTALFGAYDSQLIEVPYDKEKFDFVCFTNMKRLKSKMWDIRYVDQPVPGDNPRSAYYFKTNPHIVWKDSDYDMSIWLDSSMNKLDTNKLYAMAEKFSKCSESIYIEKHPGRNCIYEELEINCQLNKDDIQAMRDHVGQYRKEGMPTNAGLVETGMQLRRHNDPELIRFQELLWHEMTTKTRRDQLSWTYCAWKLNFRNIKLFTFQEKTDILFFVDHPHSPVHKEKILLGGPWFGDINFEIHWANYLRELSEKVPYDKIVIGCRVGREYLYKDFADVCQTSNPTGIVKFNLLDGSVPRFKIKGLENKQVDQIIPDTNLCNKIKMDIIKKHKVFVIGMFKTGTTSLGKALELLGYKTLHGPWWFTGDNMKDSFNERPDIWKLFEDKIKDMTKQYDAFQDFPWMYVYEDLIKWYPDAKFIYMTRNPIELAESERKMWERSGTRPEDILPAQTFINRYEKHQKEVYRFFKGKDNFLEMSIIDDGDGWNKLCEFLGMSRPEIPFPNINKANSTVKFKVIVPGGPAEKYIDRCMQSILGQKDVDVEVQVMLDACGDKTPEIIQKYKSDKVHVNVNREAKLLPIGNIVEGIKKLKIEDNDVIVTVDADDWLAHPNVLKTVATYYVENPHLLLTHGSWQDYPKSGNIFNNSIPYVKAEFDRGIRKGLFHGSHLRTFKYKCFKDIPDHFFKNKDGRYFDSAGDTALMFALLESAGFENIKFIPEVLYIYNRETEFNEDKVKNQTQINNLREIMMKSPYIRKYNTIKKISIVDKTFPHGKTVMNYDFKDFKSPIEWDRENLNHEIICFTDFTLNEVDKYNNKIKIALLIEPPSIFPEIYQHIQTINKKFNYVFTFSQDLIDKGENYVLYPYGGCWIEPKYQKIYPKTKSVSIIVSNQNRTIGHKLRHEIINKLGVYIEGVYGKAYSPLNLKIDGLKDYKYQIVVENIQIKNYFSEKIVDCFVTGTIPIYWGCPNLKDFGFNMDGILTFNTIDELKTILESIKNDRIDRTRAIKNNFKIAQQYAVTENGIHDYLFNELNNQNAHFSIVRGGGDMGIKELIKLLPDNCEMAEIGCYLGESTVIWASSNKIKKIYAIDPWKNGYDSEDQSSYVCSMNKVESEFDKVILPYKDKVIKYKMTSLDALSLFEDNSLDFVYIDALHTYEGIKNDIIKWMPKVKVGGILGGHDYLREGHPCRLGIEAGLGRKPDKIFVDNSWIVYKKV